MKATTIFFYIIILLIGCTKENRQKPNIDFGFTKISNSKIESTVKKYKIIPLETKDECYITRARLIIIRNNRIYILENSTGARHEIFIFSMSGTFLGKLNRQGRGAEEYQHIGDFDVNPKNNLISILDPGLRKVLIYNNKSNLIGELKLDCWAKGFKYFQEGDKLYTAFTTMMSNPNNKKGNELYIYDDNNNLLYTALPFSQQLSIGMGNGISFINSENELHYYKPNTNIVYSISSDSTKIKYIMGFPYEVLPGNEIENVFFKGKNTDLLNRHVYNIYAFETNNILYSLFMFKKNIYWCLYDKNSSKSVVYNQQKDPSCGCGITLNIKGTYKNSFVLETDYEKINKVINIIDKDRNKCTNPEIFEKIKGLDMTSNPILILVEFKL